MATPLPEIYKDTPIWKYRHIFDIDPETKEEFDEAITSKLWRLNNLYTIVNKLSIAQTFIMNNAQHLVYKQHLTNKRLIILKSRQQGISTLWLISFFDDVLFNPNMSVGLLAQGLEESETLLNKTKMLWEELSPYIKEYLDIKLVRDNTKLLEFSNGSIFRIATSFRSTTLQKVHVSELGKIAKRYPDKIKEIMTGTLQALCADGTLVFESTAEGENAFKHLWDKAMAAKLAGKSSKFSLYPIFLSWIDDPDCTIDNDEPIEVPDNLKQFNLTPQQLHWYKSKMDDELGEDIKQEYPTTANEAFLVATEFTYFARHYATHILNKKKIKTDLYNRDLDVVIACDLGNYAFVLTFWQELYGEHYLIDERVYSGSSIKEVCLELDTLDYDIAEIVLPHDAAVRSHNDGITREETFQSCGYTTSILKKTAVSDGINWVIDALIPNMYIDDKCSYIQSCLVNYRADKSNVLNVAKPKPLGDEFSHGADAVRYYAQTISEVVETSLSYDNHKIDL